MTSQWTRTNSYFLKSMMYDVLQTIPREHLQNLLKFS